MGYLYLADILNKGITPLMNYSKTDLYLFTDSSLDARLGKGVGAILILTAKELTLETGKFEFKVRTRLMETTSIAQLEIMTVLWALEEEGALFQSGGSLEIITDCQAIKKLPERRDKLESKKYCSQRTKKRLPNADLYQRFFKSLDELAFTITWIKGHSPRHEQNRFQRVFALVDKASRRALREYRRL